MRLRQSGFSLVEISIVIVVIGLLVGGVLAGRSVIRAAELRAVGTEMNNYVTAIYQFRDKYSGLPGDLVNATLYWGQMMAAMASAMIAATMRMMALRHVMATGTTRSLLEARLPMRRIVFGNI